MNQKYFIWIAMLLLLLISSIGNTIFAQASYVVEGAGSTEVNGTYVQDGTYGGKAQYSYNNGMSTYYIRWTCEDECYNWHITDQWGMDVFYVTTAPESDTPPSDGWKRSWSGINPVPTVNIAGRTLSYNTAIFREHENNDGSINSTIVITYNEFGGDALTGSISDNFIAAGKVTVINVPDGLTASIIKTAGNQLTFSLAGNAATHGQTDDVNNITVTFQTTAFNQGNASDVVNYNKSSISILYKITFSGGSGTTGSPYLISNKDDLRMLSENRDRDLWDKHYSQTHDISFQASDFQSGGDFYNGGEGWIPIGAWGDRFLGTYDGDFQTISGLFIDRSDGSFVGYLDGGAKIRNVGLIDVDVKISNGGTLVAVIYNGEIENCYVTGKLNAGTSVGGLIGSIWGGKISNSYTSLDITITGHTVGGFIATLRSGSIIENCYSMSNIDGISDYWVGGFIADHGPGTIRNSYSIGKVLKNGDPIDKGFVGYLQSGGVFDKCFWDTEASLNSTSPGEEAGKLEGKTTAQMKTQSTFTGWDFTSIWGFGNSIDGLNNGYPKLQWENTQSPASEPVKINDVYQISSLDDLRWIAENSNSWDKAFIQTANIDASATSGWDNGKGWTPIGNNPNYFSGIYDGNGKTISGLYINRPDGDSQGLFGYVHNGTVTNLGINDVDISGTSNVGGLVGLNWGFVENCFTTGDVEGTSYVGGLVGYNNGIIENCYVTGEVKGTERLGGLVGVTYKNISNSYSRANVTRLSGTMTTIGGFMGCRSGGVISNSYSTGWVKYEETIQTNKGFTGLIEGVNTSTAFSNCYWDTETSGSTSSTGQEAGKLEGKTTAQMKTQSTFTGWDFTDIWAIEEGKNNGYPYLQWQTFTPTIAAPNSQATNLVFSNSVSGEEKNILLNWTASQDAERYLVLRKTSSAATFTPIDNTEYTAGTTEGDGYVVYAGDAVNVTDANLSSGTYYYKIYAYNGSGGSSKYLTANPLSGYTIFSTDGTANIPNTGSDPTSAGFPDQGVTITFPDGTTGTDLTVTKTNSVPASNFAALPGVKGMKNLYFTISSDPSSPGAYTLILDFSSLSGMDEAKWNKFKVMKRADASSPWQDVTLAPLNATITNRQTDGVWGKFTIAGLSSFSEFGGGEGAETITVTSNAETGGGSLKQAIIDAEAGDIITFNSPMTITLTSPILIDKDLTIRGVVGGIILDGNGATRVIEIDDAITARLENLIIKNGFADDGLGGGVWNNGNLTMINCVVSENSDEGFQGAGGVIQYSESVDNANDVLNLVNSTITNNQAVMPFNEGVGGLSATSGVVNIYNTIIWGNIGDEYNDVYETMTITEVYNSCIGNLGSLTITSGSGNIASNPLFVGVSGSADHPYSISGSSPCADAGDDSYSFETTDIKGDGRKLLKTNSNVVGTIDIGAYEFNSENPLPVELTSFSVEVSEKNVLLNWQTATEANNYGFEVERASFRKNETTPLQEFEKVGFVEGHGNSNSVKEYSFVDEPALAGKYFYRLKQIDTDGTFSYSEEVEVEIANIPTDFILYQNYPNPFNPSTKIDYQLPFNSEVKIELFSITGERVAIIVNQQKEAGFYTIELNTSKLLLASGVYIYRIVAINNSNAKTYINTKKLVMLK